MSRLLKYQSDLAVFEHFDPCMGVLKEMIRSECKVCPLTNASIDKAIGDFEKYVRIKYLSNSYRCPLPIAARISIKEGFEYVNICLEEANYPVARSQKEIKDDGIPAYQLHTSKSFEDFFVKSVCPVQVAKMSIQDISRLMRLILKPRRLIRST